MGLHIMAQTAPTVHADFRVRAKTQSGNKRPGVFLYIEAFSK